MSELKSSNENLENSVKVQASVSSPMKDLHNKQDIIQSIPKSLKKSSIQPSPIKQSAVKSVNNKEEKNEVVASAKKSVKSQVQEIPKLDILKESPLKKPQSVDELPKENNEIKLFQSSPVKKSENKSEKKSTAKKSEKKTSKPKLTRSREVPKLQTKNRKVEDEEFLKYENMLNQKRNKKSVKKNEKDDIVDKKDLDNEAI